jgi:hypothetical protein
VGRCGLTTRRRRSLEALLKHGIDVKDADELQEMVDTLVDWDKVGTMGLDKGEMEMERQTQVEHVILPKWAVEQLWKAKSRKLGMLQLALSSVDCHLISESSFVCPISCLAYA